MITQIHFTTDKTMHNVTDEYKGMYPNEIKDILAEKRSQLINVCMNYTNDFNKGSILRTGNAFLQKEMYLVGNKKTDRRGMTGLHHLENLKHSENLNDVVDHLHSEGYTVVAVENNFDFRPQSVYDVELPEKTAFIYGEEEQPLSSEDIGLCDLVVYIPQRGVARSLNSAQCAAVMMGEYVRQNPFD